MSKIVAAVRGVSHKGTVPQRLLLTTRNRLSEQAHLRGPAIFAEIARHILVAEQEILLQTFVWDKSDASQVLLAALEELQGIRAAAGATRPVRVRIVLNTHVFCRRFYKYVVDELARLDLDPSLVEVQVKIPESLSEDQQQAFREFAEKAGLAF